MRLIDLIGSQPGRLARAVVGVALIAVGLRSHGGRRVLAVVGVVPHVAGAGDVCVLGPLVARPFQRDGFRRSTAH